MIFAFSYYANIQSDAQNKAKIDTTNNASEIKFNNFFIVLFFSNIELFEL